MDFLVIVIADRSWQNAVNFWECQHWRRYQIRRIRLGTIVIVTSNSLASLCENARLAIKVPWLFSNVWQLSLSNQHLSIHHEIITTEPEFDSAERLAGSSAGELLPRHNTDSRESINATSTTLALDRKPSRIPHFDSGPQLAKAHRFTK